MAYPMDCVAKATLVLASSSIITFYGPIAGTVLLIIALQFAHAATVIRPRHTTRPRPRKRSGSKTSTMVFARRGLSCRAASEAAGRRNYQARL